MVFLSASFGGLPRGGQENASIDEESVETLLPLIVRDAGSEFLQGGFPNLWFDEGLESVAAGERELTGSEIANHEELPRPGLVGAGSRVVKPEGEFLDRDSRLKSHKAKGDLYLAGALADLVVGSADFFFYSLREELGRIDDQREGRSGEGKRLRAIGEFEVAVFTDRGRLLDAGVAMRTDHRRTGESPGRILALARFRMRGVRHRSDQGRTSPSEP